MQRAVLDGHGHTGAGRAPAGGERELNMRGISVGVPSLGTARGPSYLEGEGVVWVCDRGA